MSALDVILGQDRAVSILSRQLTSGRLAHAYLFLGPAGSGKAAAALAFAAALVCTREPGGCGKCRDCMSAAAGTHPDIHTLERSGAAGEIKVGQVRDLQDALALTSFSGGNKVAVIDDAERLTAEASNAFLKTLEEPTRGTVILLVASDGAALFDTVVSRCRIIRFHPLPDEIVRDILVSRGEDTAKAETVSLIAGGSLERAAALLDTGAAENQRWLIGRMPKLRDQNPVALADDLLSRCKGKTLTESRESITTALGFLNLFLRDVRVAGRGITPPKWYSADSAPVVRELAPALTERGLDRIQAAIDRCGREIVSNVRPDLSLTTMFVSISEVIT